MKKITVDSIIDIIRDPTLTRHQQSKKAKELAIKYGFEIKDNHPIITKTQHTIIHVALTKEQLKAIEKDPIVKKIRYPLTVIGYKGSEIVDHILRMKP